MDILMTLGHNASVIGIEDGIILNGYEEERLTRKKSDSRFPINALERIVGDKKVERVFLSYWYDDFDFYKKPLEQTNKHYDWAYMNSFIKKHGCKLFPLSPDFTHHDSHASSVLAFYMQHCEDPKEGNILVVDGFGNREEVVSVYKFTISEPKVKLMFRISGYERSLGLMYQYATSFTGMKENQDEYKFLGYESHVAKILSSEMLQKIKNSAENSSNEFMHHLFSPNNDYVLKGSYIDLNKLQNVKNSWYATYRSILSEIEYDATKDIDNFNMRAIIGHYAQTYLEMCMLKLVKFLGITNLLVAGGSFYNVKLNNSLAKNVDSFCVIPLAGDQGCAIGTYYKHMGLFDFSTLCIGKRDLSLEAVAKACTDNGLTPTEALSQVKVFKNPDELVDAVMQDLKNGNIPQIVYGSMEFGPRALMHTSSLCIPSQDNVSFLNVANARNEVMPCAPVMLERNVEKLFGIDMKGKVVGSDKYMIITYDYTKEFAAERSNYDGYDGVMHKYPLEEKYSGRPQVIHDLNSVSGKILDRCEKELGLLCLVNTSYNRHSIPIVCSAFDCLETFAFQLKHSNQPSRLKLLIGDFDDAKG